MNKRFIIIIFLFFYNTVLSAKLEHNQIMEEVNRFLSINNESIKPNINPKILIPSCSGDIEIKKKYQNLSTLEINCTGKKPWKYNLRTKILKNNTSKKKKLKAHKKVIKVFVSSKKLKRGKILKLEDLKIKKVSNIGSNNTFSNLNELIGRKLKMPLKDNQILRERHLEKNWLIKEGQKVKVEHKKGNLIIIVDGKALESGMLGDYLKVKNENSGKVIQGWVKNNKKITIFR